MVQLELKKDSPELNFKKRQALPTHLVTQCGLLLHQKVLCPERPLHKVMVHDKEEVRKAPRETEMRRGGPNCIDLLS